MTNDERESPDGGLTPDAAAVVDDYFDRFRAEALAAGAPGWEEAVVDLREHVRERLEGSAGMRGDAVRVLAELGPAEALATAYAHPSSEQDPEGLTSEDGSSRWRGRLLGVPYDLRGRKSSERSARRMWNPLDRRVLVPKPLGIGWTVNFGALAVLTHLVRPDDEDTPFGAVPARVVLATLAAPLVVLAAFAAIAAVSWGQLPALVPVHWGPSGDADRFESRGLSLAFLLVLAVVPVAWAVWIHLRRRPPFNRVAACALSLSTTTLALAILLQTLFTLDGGTGLWPLWIGLASILSLPFALLVCVSRVGRAAERRRDLSIFSTKERE
jgi:Protein of unknown function (DUF1648)/Family of unknown function (DUF5808)